MSRRLKTWASVLLLITSLSLGGAVAKPEPRAVLELFVSQGCSACRPANQLMSEWARDESLIVLSFPVTYWDYLGWKDTLAHPVFTARQKGYAAARSDRKIYTPQMVINGDLSCIGSERNEILRLIDKATATRAVLPVPIRLSEENGLIIVDVASGAGDAGVWLLPVRRHSKVAIQRGENAGHTEAYTNIARGLFLLGYWSGQQARFQMPLEAVQSQDADSYVVLLQRAEDGRSGLILGAAKGPDL